MTATLTSTGPGILGRPYALTTVGSWSDGRVKAAAESASASIQARLALWRNVQSLTVIHPLEGFGWAGSARSACAIRCGSNPSSGSSIRTSPRSAAREARMYCSARGAVRGTKRAGLSKDRISQNVL